MVLSTRISVLHRILVPRSEVRLLGGQQKGINPTLTLPSKGGNLVEKGVRVMGYGQRHRKITAPH